MGNENIQLPAVPLHSRCSVKRNKDTLTTLDLNARPPSVEGNSSEPARSTTKRIKLTECSESDSVYDEDFLFDGFAKPDDIADRRSNCSVSDFLNSKKTPFSSSVATVSTDNSVPAKPRCLELIQRTKAQKNRRSSAIVDSRDVAKKDEKPTPVNSTVKEQKDRKPASIFCPTLFPIRKYDLSVPVASVGEYWIEAVLDKRTTEEGEPLYRVKWVKWALNCQEQEWWLPMDRFDHVNGKAPLVDFFEKRESIANKLYDILRADLGDEPCRLKFPEFGMRNEYAKVNQDATNEETYRLKLRRCEAEWNEKLSATGQAELYIFDWCGTGNHTFDFEFVLDMMLDEETIEGWNSDAQRIYEEDGRDGPSACQCDGPCGARCPCAMPGKDSVRMSSAGKANVNTLKAGQYIICCNSGCRCNKKCSKRIVESGRRKNIIIFFSGSEKRWSVLAAEKIEAGSYMGTYFGEVISSAHKKPDVNKKRDIAYEFASPRGNALGEFIVCAKRYANETRFFNHSCDPNLIVVNAYNSKDATVNLLGFITSKVIPFGVEITFQYTKGKKSKKNELNRCRCRPDCPNFL